MIRRLQILLPPAFADFLSADVSVRPGKDRERTFLLCKFTNMRKAHAAGAQAEKQETAFAHAHMHGAHEGATRPCKERTA
jgi:hypothetical protein